MAADAKRTTKHECNDGLQRSVVPLGAGLVVLPADDSDADHAQRQDYAADETRSVETAKR